MPGPDEIQRAQRKQSSMPARHRRGEYGIREKRKVALKKAIRPAGRQAVPTDERRNGRGHRHDGISAKKKRYLMLKRRSGRQAGRQVQKIREGMAAAIGMTACRKRKRDI